MQHFPEVLDLKIEEYSDLLAIHIEIGIVSHRVLLLQKGQSSDECGPTCISDASTASIAISPALGVSMRS
jgi:hypothetical protein